MVTPQKRAREEMEDLKRALSSSRFAHKIQMLHDADSKELLYLKLSEFLTRTTNMLGIEVKDIGLGYAEQAQNAADRINQPLVGTLFQSISNEEVTQYMRDLATLPAVRKDQDYQMATKALLRASGTRRRVLDEFPGYEDAWTEFYDQRIKSVLTGLPDLVVEDPKRKKLFEAIASVASGTVPYGLEPHKALLEECHKAFMDGRVEDLGDSLYGLTQMLVDNPPPPPPGQGRGEGEGGPSEEDPDEDSDEPQGGNGGGQNQGQGEGDESNQDDPDQNEDEGDGEGDPDEDPFEQLGEFLKSMDDQTEKPDLDSESQFDPPENPEDLDMEALKFIQATQADVGLPKAMEGKAWLQYTVPTPPNATEIWNQQMALYGREAHEVRRIIDELFRTSTIMERGLRSGRPDQTRLYRSAFNDQEVFRREEIDSVGHMDLVVLIDESGSMMATDGTKGFKLPKHTQPSRFTDNGDLMLGKATAPLDTSRVSNARIMGSLLLDASRNLSGLHVEVVGYGTNSPDRFGPLASVGEAVTKQNTTRGAYTWGGPSFVRVLGTTEKPYAILTAAACSSNADAQGLSYAVDKLQNSRADLKGIIYLADGHVYDDTELIETLLKRAKQQGVQVWFMNLSGTEYHEGALAKIPSTLVRDLKDMMGGLKKFLHRIVQFAT